MSTKLRRATTAIVVLVLCSVTLVITFQFWREPDSLVNRGGQVTGSLPTSTISTPNGTSAYVVPLCSFPNQSSVEATATAVTPNQLTFSEPQIILTSTMSVDIVGWLKDGQLLITRVEDGFSGRSIELWDAATNKVQRFGEQPLTATRPIWLENSQAVAYQDWVYTDKEAGAYQWDLWVNPGQAKAAQLVVSDLLGRDISISSSGEIVRFASDKEQLPPLPEFANNYFQQTIIPVDLSHLLTPKYAQAGLEDSAPQQFDIESSPDGSTLALFANPYLYLLNKSSNSICEVLLGGKEDQLRFPLYARWSPDGGSLAMITTQAMPGTLIEFTELTLLNALTGEQRRVSTKGNPVAATWSPDSRYLLAVVSIDNSQWRPFEKLTLIDTWTGEERILFPEQIFGGGTTIREPGLAWSTDGSMVALKCPEWPQGSDIIEDRVCLIRTLMPFTADK